MLKKLKQTIKSFRTATAFSEYVGVNKGTISRIMAGKVKPSYETMKRIIKKTDMTWSDFD